MMNLFDASKDLTGKDFTRTPAVFLSHGAPSALLDKDAFYYALESFAKSIPRPRAIAVLSAHWLTRWVVEITSSPKNETIHDFGGFPRVLYEMEYPAPGAPELADSMAHDLKQAAIITSPQPKRGLDHGAWVPLKIMYPNADVPVIQISIPYPAKGRQIFEIGSALAKYRENGVMLVGSGSMTHNLSALNWGDPNAAPAKETLEFDLSVMEKVRSGETAWMDDYGKTLKNFSLMHPTDEHFMPLFFALGCRKQGDEIRNIYDGVHYGTLSLRSFALI